MKAAKPEGSTSPGTHCLLPDFCKFMHMKDYFVFVRVGAGGVERVRRRRFGRAVRYVGGAERIVFTQSNLVCGAG